MFILFSNIYNIFIEIGDLILWQYNEDKTLDWLTPKVEKVSKVLKSQQINVNPNVAISSSFKLSDTNTQSSEGNFLISV